MSQNTTVTFPIRRTTLVARLALSAAALLALAITPVAASTAYAAPKAAAAVATARTPSAEEAAAGGVVNLNTASETELTLLPGVGKTKAAAIVAFRKKYGGFKKVDDLGRVKGFSARTLKKLRPHLAVSGATTYKGKPKKAPRPERTAVAAPTE